MQKIQDLPEELVAEILSHLLSLPFGAFAGFQYHDFIPSNYYRLPSTPCPRRAHILLVCKQWHRIGMPLLYESVIIKTAAHASNVDATVTERPYLAQNITRLQISGGMGESLDRLLLMVGDSVRTLKLGVYLRENEGVTGISRSLYRLSPLRLLLDVRVVGPSSTEEEKQAIGMLTSAMTQWTSLGRVDLVRAPEQWLCSALQQSPSLQYICLSRFEVYNFVKTGSSAQDVMSLPTFKGVIARDFDLPAAAAQRKIFEERYPLAAKYIVSDQEEPRLSMSN